MLIREKLEKLEHQILSPYACFSDQSRGRERAEKECDIRPCFQRDRDRIIHSKPFRRLKHKTQVFLAPTGDHYRTRLTHTIEVNQIARTIARALFLNEHLTEAIALGHDLGHTPFGHAGEYALNQVHPSGFRHWEQSLRVVEVLVNDGAGLNLTYEVREGILKHSKGKDSPFLGSGEDFPGTLEGRVVRVADIIAYINHDLEDALRAGLISREDIPKELIKTLGETHSQRINTMVSDLIYSSQDQPQLAMSEEILQAINRLREWLFEKVYEHPKIRREFDKGIKIVQDLYEYFVNHPEHFLEISQKKGLKFSLEQEVCDFIAGMSDRYALYIYQQIFIPTSWL